MKEYMKESMKRDDSFATQTISSLKTEVLK